MELKIDPEFRGLIPPLTADEYKRLEESLIADGCRDKLVTWDEIILDGHNRYEICKKHEIQFGYESKGLDNREQAKLWIICNQLARRNINPLQRKFLMGIQYKLEKSQGKRMDLTSDQNDQKLSTSERIAVQHHVSPITVRRAEKFAEEVNKLPPEQKQEVLSGKAKKKKGKTIFKNEIPVIKKGKPPSNGLQYARMAILQLEKIHKNDLERDQAFNLIIDWIKKNGGKI